MVIDRAFGRSYLESIRDSSGIEPAVVVDVEESAALVALIVAGAGAAFLPMRQALDARRRGAQLRTISPQKFRSIYAVRSSSPLSGPARKFLELSQTNLDRWRQSIARR